MVNEKGSGKVEAMAELRFAPKQMAARDRRLGALHEAGHFVVSDWAGVNDVGAYIRPTGLMPSLEDKAYTGQLFIKYPPGLPAFRRKMICVAGGLAEQLWLERVKPNAFDGIEFLSDPNCISPTDWEMAAEAPDDWSIVFARLAERTYALLHGQLRHKLISACRALIVDGVLVAPDASPHLHGIVRQARRRGLTLLDSEEAPEAPTNE